MSQPNVLLITNDQHRFDFLEGGAVPELRTPNLTRLRQEGTTLTNAYSSCPLCVPTRFTWWYALRASQGNGVWGDLDTEWPTHLRSMPQVLQENGYKTAVIGKIHSHSGLHKLDLTEHRDGIKARGFDHVFETAGKTMAQWHDCEYTHYLARKGELATYRRRLQELGGHHAEVLPFAEEDAVDALTGRRAREWLQSYDDDKPFFLHASYCDPHFPFNPPASFAECYNPADMPVPDGLDDPDAIARHQKVCARYCAMIEHCDHEIGLLLDVLGKRGWADDTVVVFSTDHGDMMGDRGCYGKHLPYDPSARTPITVRYPSQVPAGCELSGPVESIDLPCSILDAVGLHDEPKQYLPASPGRSWWTYVTGEAGAPREYAYSEMGPWKMAVDEEWKFIHRADGNDELYDRREDPAERCNRVDDTDQQDRVRTMQRRVIDALSQNIAPPSLTAVLLVLSLLLLGLVATADDRGQGTLNPDGIVVLTNAASKDSLKVAEHYMKQRRIPKDHLFTFEYEYVGKLEPMDKNPA